MDSVSRLLGARGGIGSAGGGPTLALAVLVHSIRCTRAPFRQARSTVKLLSSVWLIVTTRCFTKLLVESSRVRLLLRS
jgi:hypothetical protein